MISQELFNLSNKSVWNGIAGSIFPAGLETLATKLAEGIKKGDVYGTKSPDGTSMSGVYQAADGSWTLNVYASSKTAIARSFTLMNAKQFAADMGFDISTIKGVKIKS